MVKKKEKENEKKLKQQSSYLIIITACVVLLLLIIYLAFVFFNKGTYSASTAACPTGYSYKRSYNNNLLCCPSGYDTLSAVPNATFKDISFGHDTDMTQRYYCTNNKYSVNTITSVSGNYGMCADATSGSFVNCAVKPATVDCTSNGGRVLSDGTCDSGSSGYTPGASSTRYTVTLVDVGDDVTDLQPSCTLSGSATSCLISFNAGSISGKVFDYWTTTTSAGVLQTVNGSNQSFNLSYNMTWVAHWKDNNTATSTPGASSTRYTVTLVDVGDDVTDLQPSCTLSGSATSCLISFNAGSISGKVFDYWTTTTSAGVLQTVNGSNQSFNLSYNMTWVAHWKDNNTATSTPGASSTRYTVTLVDVGDDVTDLQPSCTLSGSATSCLISFNAGSISGKVFDYWTTTTSAGVLQTVNGSNQSFNLSYNMTWVAHWKDNSTSTPTNPTPEVINATRCDKTSGEKVYVTTCENYKSGTCITNPKGNASVKCTLRDGSTVNRCDLADESNDACSLGENINGTRCDKTSGEKVYVTTCENYKSGTCISNPQGNADVKCTLRDGSTVNRCDLAEESNIACNPLEDIKGIRCNKKTGEKVYVNTCESYKSGTCISNPQGNADVKCTLDNGTTVNRCDLAEESNGACNPTQEIQEGPKTGTTAIIVAWIVGIMAIGYSFWYFVKSKAITNK